MRLSWTWVLFANGSMALVLQAPTAARKTSVRGRRMAVAASSEADEAPTRRQWLQLTVVGAPALVSVPLTASARGRGTQPAMFQRYQPRIAAYGDYVKKELPKVIDSADWAALKEATAADVKTKKGKVGPLYNGESAMKLWASTYSETAITDKTKEMDAEVDILTATRLALQDVALKGTGEGLKKVGGVFGIGAKPEPKPSDSSLQRDAKKAVASAVKAYNEYVDINNVGIPFEINPLDKI